ncbi:MAG: MOSC N-terminal beta barrel domain-containing protein [Gemmatimonadota bacterium]
MSVRIGTVAALFRYPVKSMRGLSLDGADLGWHGLAGDRRLAFRRTGDQSGFPWLTASKLPELIRFAPRRLDADGELPTHVHTPDGAEFAVFSPELAAEVGRRAGTPVEMLHVRQGIFDDAPVSIISAATIEEIGTLASQPPDVRRFRPNILIATDSAVPFEEDQWTGRRVSFGEGSAAPSITVTMHDVRCSMVNLEPDSARATPEVLRTIVRIRDNKAGVYGTVTRVGRLEVGQPVFLERSGNL